MFRIWWAVIRSVESLGAPGALVRSRILVRPEMPCEVICPLVDALADVADVVGGGSERGGGDGGGGWRGRLGPLHLLLRRRVLSLSLILHIGWEDGRQQQIGACSVAQDVDAILLRHGQSHRRGCPVVLKVEEEDRKLRVPGGGGGTGKWMNVVLPRCQMVPR